MWWIWLAGCGPEVRAIVDPSRAEHFFDEPFPGPSHFDAQGRPVLEGWPLPEVDLARDVIGGWVERLPLATHGAANHGAAYFRFDGPLVDLPDRTEGLPDDPVLWVGLDAPELLALEVRFVEDPNGDPHWAPNTLALAPALGHAPRAGGRYAAVVMADAGAGPAKGWEVPDEVADALDAVGVKGRVAVATTFTVQDATGELRALFADVDRRGPDFGTPPTFKRVTRIAYRPGETPSGRQATVFTATYEDGTSAETYLGFDPGEDQEIDLADWPMVVFEASIPTLNYQDPDDRPYMSPGLLTVGDTGRFSGWIEHDGQGRVVSEPWLEPMRITVSIPKGPDGEPIQDAKVVIWDHGTGGHAYNVVQRASSSDDSRALAQAFADAGWATIGRDATLYGTRYPLIDQGYDSSLGFYNVVNLPAFRDNQRQTAVDGHVLLRYVQGRLNGDLPAGGVDPTRIRRAGHSLGSVTSHLGVAGEPGAYESVFLSGTGGVFSHYYLDTGLLVGIDPALIASLFPLFGVPAPDEIDTTAILGAVAGLPPEAWEHLDRLHPLFTIFQWTMDPSDPMTTARDEALPAFLSISPGDRQTPDFTAEALAGLLPDATVRFCEARGDYDPHHCLWREPEGPEILAEWLAP